LVKIGTSLVVVGSVWVELVLVGPKTRRVGLKGFRFPNYRCFLEPFKAFSYMIGMGHAINIPKVQLLLDLLSETIPKPREDN